MMAFAKLSIIFESCLLPSWRFSCAAAEIPYSSAPFAVHSSRGSRRMTCSGTKFLAARATNLYGAATRPEYHNALDVRVSCIGKSPVARRSQTHDAAAGYGGGLIR